MITSSKYLAVSLLSLSLAAGYVLPAQAEVGNVCYVKAEPNGDKTKCCAIYNIANGKMEEKCEKIIKGVPQDHCKATPGSRTIRCGTDGNVICEKNINGKVVNVKDLVPPEACPTNQPAPGGAENGKKCPAWLNGGIPHTAVKTAQVGGQILPGGAMVAIAAPTPTAGGGSISIPFTEMVCPEATDEESSVF